MCLVRSLLTITMVCVFCHKIAKNCQVATLCLNRTCQSFDRHMIRGGRLSGTPDTGRVTLKQVAEVMGLAPSTVSRAFTDPDRGNFQTVEKIMQVAQKMGYRRHPPRLTPERTLSRTINLIVQDSSNPFYVDFLGGVLEQTRNAGYLTMV